MKMLVEIPKKSSNKYEYNLKSQKWELDRVLSGSMFYPEEYGFLEETLDYDGDPLDVICINNTPVFSGCYLPIRIIGVLKMIDGEERDDKIMAVNDVDPRLDHIKKIEDLNINKINEIKNFFQRYKELENKTVNIMGIGDKKEAEEILSKCQNLYIKYKKQFFSLEKKDLLKLLSSEKH